MTALPEAPQDVRVVLANGTEFAAELVYLGLDERGLHVWEATAALPHPVLGGLSITARTLPAHTSIQFRLAD